MTILQDILVPLSVLRDPATFGGTTDKDCLRGDLHVTEGQALHLEPAPATNTPRLLTPALTEAHCHLDKCHSGNRMGSIGGDLKQAIEAQAKDKIHWTQVDLRERMQRGIADAQAAGCTALRSHIDWEEHAQPPLSWSVLAELAQDTSRMVVQSAALMGIEKLSDREFCFDVARHVSAHQAGVLGAFVLHHDQVEQALQNMFAAAEAFGLALDFHVDEGLGPLDGVERVCDAALAARFEGPILCGHAVGLIEKDQDDMARISDKLLRAGIAVCALPTTNLYLQGRRDGTPDRRGLTRLCELQTAGVPIVVASDNVDDAFCPMGQHDPRAALHLASLAAHLDPPMGDWLPTITSNAAQALGLPPSFVDTAPIEDLRLCAVASTADFIAGRAPLASLSAHIGAPSA